MVSRRLATDLGWPLMSLDVLKMGLSRAVPFLGVDPEAPSSEVGRVMWPLVRAMVENALEAGTDYLFEGDMLFPHQVSELGAIGDGEVVACFLGYRRVAPARKLADIRRFAGLPNDWLSEHDDATILDEVRAGIATSEDLASACERHGLRYFDGSTNFEVMVDEAVAFLESHHRP